MLGEVAVEAVDRQVEPAVLIPADTEIALVERPVAGLGRDMIPIEPPRLVEPEGVGVARFKVVEFCEFERSDPGLEIVRDRMDR